MFKSVPEPEAVPLSPEPSEMETDAWRVVLDDDDDCGGEGLCEPIVAAREGSLGRGGPLMVCESHAQISFGSARHEEASAALSSAMSTMSPQ